MIKITTLVENTSISPKLKTKHGLSIYIETSKHKILFDVGPNEFFIENAQKLGVDISAVDTVVISHGHADHGGALEKFLEVNKTAKIYVKESAFDEHCTKPLGIPVNIGLDRSLMVSEQIVFTSDDFRIDDELTLFSGVTARKLFSKGNAKLLVKRDRKIVPDEFEHEQYLVITDGDKQVMITGCSHNGIINIVEKYMQMQGGTNKLTSVFGGFHLFDPTAKKYESEELISGIAAYLRGLDAKFYTCHCTGQKAYDILKGIMGDKLNYLSTGTVVDC